MLGFSALNQTSEEWGLEPVGKVLMLSPQLIPLPESNRRLLPIMPPEAVVPVSLAVSAPTSSFTGSAMWKTQRKPLESLNTAAPLDSLAASVLPQNILIAWWALPVIVGMRTQMLADPAAASHSSI